MRADPANHAGWDRLSADILGPELKQVNVMRCHPNEVPECFEAGEKHGGMKEFAARKFLGSGFVSIFRVAVPA
jgi:hypothetical protein